MKMRKKRTLMLICLLLNKLLFGQDFPFYHLNTANGLTSNQVTSATLDKNGMMWIGTPEGLNSFDGNKVVQYRKAQYPAMGNNDITTVFCDSRNRLWMGSYFEAFYLDEHRIFHPMVHDSGRLFGAMIIETKPHGILISANYGHFYFDEKNMRWKQSKWSQDSLFKIGWRENIPMGNDQFIHVGSQGRVVVIDFDKKTIPVRAYVNKYVTTACPLNKNEIILADSRSTLHRVSLADGKVLKEYLVKVDYKGMPLNARITTIRKITDNLVLIGTQGMGLLLFDAATEKFTHFTHDPFNKSTIRDDFTRPLYTDTLGNIIISCNSGLSYANVLAYSASHKEYFSDENKQVYSGPIHCIEETAAGVFWLGGADRLIRWEQAGNRASYFFFDTFEETNSPKLLVTALQKDTLGRLWVGTRGGGIRLLNPEGKLIKILKHDTDSKKSNYPTNFVNHFRQEGNKMWVSTRLGVIVTDLLTFKTDSLHRLPGFKDAPVSYVHLTYKDKAGNHFIAADQKAMYRYTVNGQMNAYRCGKEMINYFFRGVAEDKNGNVYFFGTRSVDIVSSTGTISAYTNQKELRNERTQSALVDSLGNIWFANNNQLGYFNGNPPQFVYFGQSYGVPAAGFEEDAAKASQTGQFLFGAKNGVVFFKPPMLRRRNNTVPILLHNIQLSDTLITNTSMPLELNYNNSFVEFNFAVVDIYGSANMHYQYLLEGAQKQWSAPFQQNSIRFATLAPGTYRFLLRASRNGANWFELKNPVSITVHPPFWKTTWFYVLCICGAILALFAWQKFREANIRKMASAKLAIEKQIAHLETKALRSQMNPHFIFNSLNSISMLVAGRQNEKGLEYLNKFSKLLRLVLDESENNLIPLKEEIRIMDLYLQLEKLRFGEGFVYSITVDDEIDDEETEFPSLLLHPLVENAVWHGLLHKDGGRRLMIDIKKSGPESLICVVKDNGIGMEAAAEMKQIRLNGSQQKSKGLQLVKDRIALLNAQYRKNITLTIADMKDPEGLISGTKASVELPLYYD